VSADLHANAHVPLTSCVPRPIRTLVSLARRAIRGAAQRLDQIVGSLAARSIPIESLGRRRAAPPDRSAVCAFIARSRRIAHCPPPQGCAL